MKRKPKKEPQKKKAAKKEGCYKMEGKGMVYFLGFIGAAVYFIQQSSNFGSGVVGVLKAAVWPAFLIYELLKYLKM